MKKTTEDLFALIKSLEKNEKRYFKRFAAMHVIGSQNKYVQLFNAVDAQKYYDEKKLRERFADSDFVKQFPVAKNRLYGQILKAMRSFHHSIHAEVKNLLRNAEFLYDKGLYGQAHKEIRKAKQIAKENEMYWAMLEIFRLWEMNLAMEKNDLNWLKNIITEKEAELKLLYNTEAYRDIDFSMHRLYSTYGRTRKKGGMAEMEKIMNSSLLQNEKNALTFESRLRLFNAHAIYHDAKGNVAAAYRFTQKVVGLFHENPEKMSANFISYITRLGNAITGALHAKKHEESVVFLDAMKRAFPLAKNLSQQARIFYYYHCYLLNYYTTTAQFAGAAAIIPSAEKELSKHERHLSGLEKTFLFSNIALAFFGNREYHKSILWINRIHNEVIPIHFEFQSPLLLFSLIVHYEAGHTDLLPYLIRSAYRFLKGKGQLYKFEIIILDFLRNELPKVNPDKSGQKELTRTFQKLKKKIEPLAKDSHEKNAFHYFDYICWLESKIKNRSFAKIVREKAEKAK